MHSNAGLLLRIGYFSALVCCLAAVTHSQGGGVQAAVVKSKCQGDQVAERLVVAARFKEDISWMAVHLEVPFIVYQAEESAMHQFLAHRHSNSAREASAYLMFIAEYYECLPKMTAFVHGHRSSWHSTDVVEDLNTLQWGQVGGYLPLSKSYFSEYGPWFISYAGAPRRHLQIPVKPDLQNETLNKFEVFNGSMYTPEDVFHYRQASDVAAVWQDLLEPAGFGSVPEEIEYFCCGQFVVPAETIRLLPHSFYLRAVQWLEKTDLHFNLDARYSKAIVFETIWHILFGQDHILARPSDEEECQLYTCS